MAGRTDGPPRHAERSGCPMFTFSLSAANHRGLPSFSPVRRDIYVVCVHNHLIGMRMLTGHWGPTEAGQPGPNEGKPPMRRKIRKIRR